MGTKAERYWDQYLTSLPADERGSLSYRGPCWFGLTWDDAREIAPLVLSATKTATGGLLWAKEADGEPLPRPGDRWVVLAGPDEPVCVIETTSVEVLPYDEVPETYAWEGGEGDRTLATWRRMYWEMIVAECERIGREPSPKAPLAMERFRVVYDEPLRDRPSP